jgi:cobalamin biosynthesis Mg chelatase CobN
LHWSKEKGTLFHRLVRYFAEVSKGKQKVKELQDKVLDKITRARFYAWCNTKGIELKHY